MLSITAAVKKLLNEECRRDDMPAGKKRRWAEVCAESLLVNFCAGNAAAIKQVLDRVDGLVLPPKDDNDVKQAALENLVLAMQGYAKTVVTDDDLGFSPEPDDGYLELD